MSKRRAGLQDTNYEVGYGKPPTASRFVKGQSGNPSGRPKRKKQTPNAKSQTEVLHEIAQRKIPVLFGGKESIVTMLEAVTMKTFQAALAGDQAAVRTIFKAYPPVEAMLERNPPFPEDEMLAAMNTEEIAKTYNRLFGGGRRSR
jgi:hypothetical protein